MHLLNNILDLIILKLLLIQVVFSTNHTLKYDKGACEYDDNPYTVLGQGATGTVYSGTIKTQIIPHTFTTSIDVAVKSALFDRLEKEYQAFKALQLVVHKNQPGHKSIVKCYHFFDMKPMAFLALEKTGGTGLDMCTEVLPDRTIMEIGNEILDALEYIHSRGRVHGDIKIDNFAFNLNPKESLIKIFDFEHSIVFEAIETAPIDWFRAELSFRQDILRLAKMLIQLAGSTIPIKVLYGKGNKSEHFIRNNIVHRNEPCSEKLIQFFEAAWNLNTNQINYTEFRAILNTEGSKNSRYLKTEIE